MSKCRWPQKVRVKLLGTSDIRRSFQNGMICVKSNSSMCLRIQMFINYDKKNNITAYLAYKKPSEYSSSTEQLFSQDMSDPFLSLQFLSTLYQCNFFDSTVLWDNLYANWKNVHSYVESFWNKNNCNKHSYIWYTNLWVEHNWSYDPGISYQSWKK